MMLSILRLKSNRVLPVAPAGPGCPGGRKPFGPGMGPEVEYPKGLKLY
jgi:hypothetical protein